MNRAATVACAGIGVLALILSACGGATSTATPAPKTQTPNPTVAPALSATLVPAPAATATPIPTATAAPPTPTPGAQAKIGGVLPMRFNREPNKMDTWDTCCWHEVQLMGSMMNNLVIQNPYKPGEFVGDLVERWEIGADGKSLTYLLRGGVKWHDGKPFVSQDVAYNFQRAMNPPTTTLTFLKDRVANVATVTAPDDRTVKLDLKEARASFFERLHISMALMYPPQVPDNTEFRKRPIGTGPFKFVEYTPGSLVRVQRNDQYFKTDTAGRRLPYLDGLTYFIINDPAAASAAFRTGRTKATDGSNDGDWISQQVDGLKRQVPGVTLNLFVRERKDIYFNQTQPWTDPRVRKAINLALDRQQHSVLASGGIHYPFTTPMLPGPLGGQWAIPDEEMRSRPGFREAKAQDLAEAKRLLAEAKVDPATISVNYLVPDFYRPEGEASANLLRQALGLDIKMNLASNATLIKERPARNFDWTLANIAIVVDDPLQLMGELVGTDAPLNYAKWSDPKLDGLLSEQDRTLDPARRKVLIVDAQREYLDWLADIPTTWDRGYFGWHPDVKNTPPVMIGTMWPYYRWEAVWLEP